MEGVVYSRSYGELPVDEREILRYAGGSGEDGRVTELMRTCVDDAAGVLQGKVCFRELRVTVQGDLCDFGLFAVRSEKLAVNLDGCSMGIVFAATVGVGIDRLIAKYGRLSPAKALMFQAVGAERIEALCNAFCGDLEQEYGAELRPRFSPGYGDLPLEAQKSIFSVLDCERRIGLTLNDSLIMSPSKSVTAFVGVSNRKNRETQSRCAACNREDCAFRRDIL